MTSSAERGRAARLARLGAVVVAVCLVAVASGCTAESPVAAAEQNVAEKQEALADAQADAAEASAEFCTASTTYLTALDRYGDVLHDTAPTVGDVTDAGSDLTKPAEKTRDAAQDAVDAREAVATAEDELADAQDTLATAQAVAADQPPPTPTEDPPSGAPSQPPASVLRVQQAETEFATAQAGITDQTPLREAAEQFNAAAVALEMAWLQLVAQSGCLTDDQQAEAASAASAYTAALQQSLAITGYYAGAIDGIYGPETAAAVAALQEANGLPQTGTLDRATDAALQAALEAKGGAAADESLASTAALQQTLKLVGYWDGPVDGEWTDELTAALGAAQTTLGVPVTGTVDAATVAAFQAALATARAPDPPAETPEPTESATG
ncbi:peptidoglycan-binding domain-containing protein [Cellulomonas sp.]|uniref:peptidoglycan-binding domain-containing protein n=1 Tax=Cellulomonas sp. TaxID=40001 RepID=UPI003BABAE71